LDASIGNEKYSPGCLIIRTGRRPCLKDSDCQPSSTPSTFKNGRLARSLKSCPGEDRTPLKIPLSVAGGRQPQTEIWVSGETLVGYLVPLPVR